MGAIAEPAMAAAAAAAQLIFAGGKVQPLGAFLGALFFLHGSGLCLQSQCVGQVLTGAWADTNYRPATGCFGLQVWKEAGERGP
jgi:hypothetical protein